MSLKKGGNVMPKLGDPRRNHRLADGSRARDRLFLPVGMTFCRQCGKALKIVERDRLCGDCLSKR
jgi:ribosomal protein L32